MNIPTCAGFIAEFPDDMVEEDSDIKVFGGRNVAIALGEILGNLGCDRISSPRYDGENGWVFTLDYGRRHSFFCQITSLHPAFWLLFEGFSSKTQVNDELWQKLSRALDQDPRFHCVIWRSKQDGPPEVEEIGDERLREAVSRIPPEPIPEKFRPPRHTPVRVNRAHYAFALIISIGVSVPFAIAGWFCAFLVYLGAWWAVFGIVAVALAWWFYIGKTLLSLLRPLPRQPVLNSKT